MAAPAVVLTGSQLPLSMPRTDARQNLVDSITCATVGFMPSLPLGERVNLQEVAICFGGKLLRANRARKLHSSNYQAFDSPTYEPLAQLGVEVEWNPKRLLRPADIVYQPRFNVSFRPVAAVRARGRAREEAGEADARPRPAPRR